MAHHWEKPLEEQIDYVRRLASANCGRLAQQLGRLADNLEIIMGRVSKIIAAENTRVQNLTNELTAAQQNALDADDIKAVAGLAVANALDPATGDAPAAAPTGGNSAAVTLTA